MLPVNGIFSEGPALTPLGEPRDEVTAAVEQVLAELPRQSRAAAELRLRHQRSTSEIATELGITRATVERHIRQITAALTTRLPLRLG